MTDEQIIKALECCATDDGNDCFQCPYCNLFFEPGNGGCVNRCRKDALDLINRQKAEIEELYSDKIIAETHEKAAKDLFVDCARQREEAKTKIERLQTRNDELNILNKTASQEAIKEFAERLIKTADYDDEYSTVFVYNIKKLVKEMTEVQE